MVSLKEIDERVFLFRVQPGTDHGHLAAINVEINGFDIDFIGWFDLGCPYALLRYL